MLYVKGFWFVVSEPEVAFEACIRIVSQRFRELLGCKAIFEILDAAEQAGARGIVVHARYASQMHSGPLDLEALALEAVGVQALLELLGDGHR